MRADEYDAAQERGEVAGHGGDRGNQHVAKVPGQDIATVTQVGLTRQQIHEARHIQNAEIAEPGIIARTLKERVERAEELSKKALRAAVVNAAQERGEVRTRAGNQLVAGCDELSIKDLGPTRKQVHEARQIRNAERTG